MVLVGLLEAAVIGGGLPRPRGGRATGDDAEDAKGVVLMDVAEVGAVAELTPAPAAAGGVVCACSVCASIFMSDFVVAACFLRAARVDADGSDVDGDVDDVENAVELAAAPEAAVAAAGCGAAVEPTAVAVVSV